MQMRIRKQHIPWLMATARALLGPVLVIGEKCGWKGFTLAALIVTALLSDIFDGILAPRWNCDTAAVRLFDSMPDTFFYAFVVAALWIGRPAEGVLRAKAKKSLRMREVYRSGGYLLVRIRGWDDSASASSRIF